MSCECAQCRQHYKTLGIAFGIPEEAAIEEAYREGVKQWHPDLFENYASLRADAEEHFKQLQVAYRELKEHNTVAAEVPTASVSVQSPIGVTQSFVRQATEETPVLSFGNAPGCLSRRQFTPEIEEMVTPHMGKLGMAQAIVDLSGKPLRANYAQFLLLAARGMMLRDARHNISLLWYADMGEVRLTDPRKRTTPRGWRNYPARLSGAPQGYELQIGRSNGVLFTSISTQADDSVKTVIYEFLMHQKNQPQA